jgi:hypothetical protein
MMPSDKTTPKKPPTRSAQLAIAYLTAKKIKARREARKGQGSPPDQGQEAS